ncbi:acyclic terpene utilization AtuA family protein [Bacillus sp. SCS-151]|uniref:acyclic terpene utilization AtuA family protein n=1 Tax=Nanhaiella sioensis TaxID=3115293 RepID=UPI0039798BD7
MKSIRIGAAQGFYGDTIEPAIATAKHGNVDYLCFDCLAELTMAILLKDQQKDPHLGYARDITISMKALLPYVKEQGMKILTNAGGLNPLRAQQEVIQIARQNGFENIKIAVVTGDHIYDDLEDLIEQGVSLDHFETNESFRTVKDKVLFANAYLGAQPIVEALKEGADIVITGRTTDTAQFLAPLIYEYNWGDQEWDKLASGVFMGHLLECSAQSTGGNYSGEWHEVAQMDEIGYPIAECQENGEFIVSKVKERGGLITPNTLKEQMLYEIHDPSAYITPDVVVDLMNVKLEQVAENEVLVTGVKGKAKPAELKVVMGFDNGYMGQVITGFAWPNALEKAKKADEIIRLQAERSKLQFDEIKTDFIGYNALHGPLATEVSTDSNEIFLRMAIRTKSKRDAISFSRLFPPLALNGPPSMGAYIGNIPPRKLFGMWATLIPRHLVEAKISVTVQEV